jgi:hypothetical protein
MAQGFALDISGVKNIERAIKRIDEKATKGLSDELSASALNIQRNAKRMAPANLGKLRQSINIDINKTLFKSVFSSVRYAPYVEFGTKGNARIPSGYEAFAAQYKGKGGGTIMEMVKALTLWVKRKGIDPKFTFVIVRAILRNGIKPQPFFIPAFEAEKPKLLSRLKKLFK